MQGTWTIKSYRTNKVIVRSRSLMDVGTVAPDD
jgi:hypothetical protein